MTLTLTPQSPEAAPRAASAATSAAAAPSQGKAIYFDGVCSRRREVLVELEATGLRIAPAYDSNDDAFGGSAAAIDEWAYGDLRRLSAPEGVLRLGRSRETVLARLEIRDPDLAAAIEERAVTLDRGGAAERALRRKIVALSFAAGVSLVLTAIFGLPELASRLIPLVPASVERRLGEAVDRDVRAALDSKHLGPAFACGRSNNELPGRAALDELVGKLEAAAALPVALHVDVVRRNEPNAIALPGGHVYVEEGLINQAQTPDELAGVLAHEIGHIAHRDGTRVVLQTAGLSFLFGMMLGDFVGGGAVVIAARTVLKSSYSRHVESAADAYSVALMQQVGGDPRALGTILSRIVVDKEHGMKILADHPETKDRIAAINAMAKPVAGSGATAPLLDVADWNALKQICAPPPAKDANGRPK
jgi:Zn-dependent protease with chaperone function